MEDVRMYLLAEWQKPKRNERLNIQVRREINYGAESLCRSLKLMSLAPSFTLHKLRY